MTSTSAPLSTAVRCSSGSRIWSDLLKFSHVSVICGMSLEVNERLESQLMSKWNADALRLIKMWPVFVENITGRPLDYYFAHVWDNISVFMTLNSSHFSRAPQISSQSSPHWPPFDFHLSPTLTHVLTVCIWASVSLFTVWTFVSDGNDPLILTRGLFCCSVTFNHRLHFTQLIMHHDVWMNEWMNEWMSGLLSRLTWPLSFLRWWLNQTQAPRCFSSWRLFFSLPLFTARWHNQVYLNMKSLKTNTIIHRINSFSCHRNN